MGYTLRETNTRPLPNASAFWAGRVENLPGRVEFCTEHIRDIWFGASAPEILFSKLLYIIFYGIFRNVLFVCKQYDNQVHFELGE